jgi:hypothetical protein
MPEIDQRIRSWIEKQPEVKKCLEKNLIERYTLSKLISKEEGFVEEAVFQVVENMYPSEQSAAINFVIANSIIETRSKISTLATKNDWKILLKIEKILERMLQVITTSSSIILVMEEPWLEESCSVVGREEIIYTEKSLSQIIITSPQEIETTPGVVSRFYGMLALKGVNVVETVSCSTDTIFLVKPDQFLLAYTTLRDLITNTRRNADV